MFNDRTWPDFVALSEGDLPLLRLERLEPGVPIELEGLRITPIPVNHVVPTLGFLIEDGHSAVVIASDTGPTELLWQRANAAPHLDAVFLEAAFPNAMAGAGRTLEAPDPRALRPRGPQAEQAGRRRRRPHQGPVPRPDHRRTERPRTAPARDRRLRQGLSLAALNAHRARARNDSS